jgi:hypothetical protein
MMMESPSKLLHKLNAALDPMENDSLSVIQYATLLTVLTSGPDAETAMDGIHCLMFEIRDHGENLEKQYEAAHQVVEALIQPITVAARRLNPAGFSMMEERGSGPRLIESLHRQAPVLFGLAGFLGNERDRAALRSFVALRGFYASASNSEQRLQAVDKFLIQRSLSILAAAAIIASNKGFFG